MLFTDIEGSTRAVRGLGADRWEGVLERHTRIIREALGAGGGVEVRTEGDSFFAVFTSPSAALAAAAEMQRRLNAADWGDTAVRVRMGIHTGEARPASVASGVDYVGFEISRAARIAAAAHGAQVLVSDTTEALARDNLAPGLSLRDLGEHRFKDLVRPQRIHQLLIEGLPDRFPPLRSLDATPNNLPTQTTSFVGRRHELATAAELLETTRLLTLTGPGGSGKTRLAFQVAADVLDRYPDGVWLVELAAVGDPDEVVSTVAAAVHVSGPPGSPAVDTLGSALRHRQLMLMLDNCEHVISGCADVANALLRSCPRVTILATSREGLNVPGESLMPVPPLRLPEGDHLPPIEELREFEAVRLFVDRCTAYQGTFALTTQNATDVVRICRRLDGIPLALELAAARVRVLSVAQVAARLDDRFRLLTGGGRTVVARQQTLRALIDWSYELLDGPERILLRRLSVFVGGGTLEAAEAVCAGEGVRREEIFDHLAHLVDKSLVAMHEHRGAARYSMLETIREYAREKLVESGEAAELRQRHSDHFFMLSTDLWNRDLAGARAAAGAEYENFRTAFEWIQAEPDSAEQQLLMAASMGLAASYRGRIAEMRQLLTGVLARSDSQARTLGRVRAMQSAARLAGMQGDIAAATKLGIDSMELLRQIGEKRDLAYALTMAASMDPAGNAYRESRALFDELGDKLGAGMLMFITGDGAKRRGDYETARARYTESLALFREIGNFELTTNPLISLGVLACIEGDYGKARALVEESLAIRRGPGLDNPWRVAIALVSLGEIDRCEGDATRGAHAFEEALMIGRDLGDDMIVGWSLHNLGHVAMETGNLEEASSLFRESLLLRMPLGPGADVASVMCGIAGVRMREGDLMAALKAFGAAEKMLNATNFVLPPADEKVRSADLGTIHSQLGHDAFWAALREGETLSFEELETLANPAAKARVAG